MKNVKTMNNIPEAFIDILILKLFFQLSNFFFLKKKKKVYEDELFTDAKL